MVGCWGAQAQAQAQQAANNRARRKKKHPERQKAREEGKVPHIRSRCCVFRRGAEQGKLPGRADNSQSRRSLSFSLPTAAGDAAAHHSCRPCSPCRPCRPADGLHRSYMIRTAYLADIQYLQHLPSASPPTPLIAATADLDLDWDLDDGLP